MPFVVDASIVAAWFLPDETNDAADKALDMLETDDAFAPDLLSHELRNILLSAEKRKRIDQDAIFSILLRFTNLPLTLVSGGDQITIMRLAKKHSLSAYDAAYLALAVSRAMPLATSDKKLADAAAAENVAFA
ncbi:putative nucleic acid-binding protein, contains PIN domain [Agrobacterium sp. DSM 25558]|uniref:type II toxin-antitoxin system VapC family toxin n=1 Tax=Agrobacterium sp. DSM 25558 TaxID=1907665 RepID=UPI000972631B|nr:type II toxin-antitoxin system VapC family toxin [Agrobacterium sp. DSM 25558]SCX26900.1 putative nucleic acid-binding protein, contains PIN domain [Agrobacterium sp. DSM 25558]